MLDALTTTWPILATAATRDEEEFITELRNMPEGWFGVAAILALILLCAAVVWMYRHEGRRGATPRVRMMLAVVRCAVIVSLAAIFLEPVSVRILRRWIDSYTIVLLDDSSSMDLADRYRDSKEAEKVRQAMDAEATMPLRRADVLSHLLNRNNRELIADLADKNRLKLYAFSDIPNLMAIVRANRESPSPDSASTGATENVTGLSDSQLQVAGNGAVTNLDRAVRRSVESLGSAPIAAVVVMSDGGFNQGGSAEDIAAYAKQRRLPIHVVGIGDPAMPRNVRITELIAPQNALKGDPYAITAQLSSQGLSGQIVTVRLREQSASTGGDGSIVDTKRVRIAGDSDLIPVVFERHQDQPDQYRYTVDVPVLETESVVDDNSKQTAVTVIDARTRVLVISGGPSWEYRYLTRLLERDETFEVSCWLQSADLSAVRDGNTVIDHLPRLPEELLEYDVVVLMDPDHQDLDDSWCRNIDTLVTRHSGGVLLAAGRAHTPEFFDNAALSKLIDLLPIVPDPESDLVLNQIGHYQLSSAPIHIPPTAFGHPIMKLGDDLPATKLGWQDAASVYWHFPVLHEKPVATVLMRHGDPRMRSGENGHVLAAVQFVGSGRAAFLAFDHTWRWRKQGTERFDRFWVQMLRYLAEGKLLGGAKRGMIVTQSDQFSLGEAIPVSARLFDARFEPLRRDFVQAFYEIEGRREPLTLRARADRPGWFEGRFVPDRTGSYRVFLTLPDPSQREPREVSRQIRVSRPNIEVLRPQLDRTALRTVATNSEGGRYLDVNEAGLLPDLIEDMHEEVPIRSRPKSLWDRWEVMAVLMGLLVVEWAVRKWNRLL